MWTYIVFPNPVLLEYNESIKKNAMSLIYVPIIGLFFFGYSWTLYIHLILHFQLSWMDESNPPVEWLFDKFSAFWESQQFFDCF